MNLGSGASIHAGSVGFATTHWSVVLTAQGQEPAEAEIIFEANSIRELCVSPRLIFRR
jgi:hypothetical protein